MTSRTYAASPSRLRSGLATATASTDCTASRSMTPFQLADSANAPCTRTTTGFSLMGFPSLGDYQEGPNSRPSCDEADSHIRSLCTVLLVNTPDVSRGERTDEHHRTADRHVGPGDRNRWCGTTRSDRAGRAGGRGPRARQTPARRRAHVSGGRRHQRGAGHDGPGGHLAAARGRHLAGKLPARQPDHGPDRHRGRRPWSRGPGALGHAVRPRGRRPDLPAVLRRAHVPSDGVRRRLHRAGDPAHADQSRGPTRRTDPRHGLRDADPGQGQHRVRRVRVRPHHRAALRHPRRCGDPGDRWSHPDLAAYVVAPGREHRRLIPPRAAGRRPDPRPRARPVPPLRALAHSPPPGLIAPESAAGPLASGPARGEGGRLRNALGERFMTRYDAERMELSTRDRVALAEYTEIKEGRGTPNGGVWLDVSHLPRETIMRRLPRVYQTLLELQMLDITKQPIEIAPTAHYSMGGVWVRPEDHGTGVDGLWAIGEAASGLHGANRLGGNSLIELLVFGRIVAEEAAKYSIGRQAQLPSAEAVAEARAEIDDLLANDGPENVRALQRALRDTMTARAGVVRDETGLQAGLSELTELEERMAQLGVHPDIAGFQDLAHAFDLKSSTLAARATLDAALVRRETRGCHNRSDFPELDEPLQVTLVWPAPVTMEPEQFPPIPAEFRQLMRHVSTDGKLVE